MILKVTFMSKMAANVSGIISNKERIGRMPHVSIIFLQTFSAVFNIILIIVCGNGLLDYIYLPKKADNKLCWKQKSMQLEKWRMDLGMETSTSLCSQVYVYTHRHRHALTHAHNRCTRRLRFGKSSWLSAFSLNPCLVSTTLWFISKYVTASLKFYQEKQQAPAEPWERGCSCVRCHW